MVATEAAYSKGEEWYQAMHAYVEANIDYTREYVERNLPGVKMTDLEGTYLVWLDFRETGLGVEEWRPDHSQGRAVAGQRKDFRKSRRGLPENQCSVPKSDTDRSIETNSECIKGKRLKI